MLRLSGQRSQTIRNAVFLIARGHKDGEENFIGRQFVSSGVLAQSSGPSLNRLPMLNTCVIRIIETVPSLRLSTIVFALFLGSIVGCDRGSHPSQVGQRAPDFTVSDSGRTSAWIVQRQSRGAEFLGDVVRTLHSGVANPNRHAAPGPERGCARGEYR